MPRATETHRHEKVTALRVVFKLSGHLLRKSPASTRKHELVFVFLHLQENVVSVKSNCMLGGQFTRSNASSIL